MATSGDDPPRKRKGGNRRKTGCQACKARHIRCDEQKPICGNCKRLSLECQRSDFITPSSWWLESINQSSELGLKKDSTTAIIQSNFLAESDSSSPPTTLQDNNVTNTSSDLSADVVDLSAHAASQDHLTLTSESVYLLDRFREVIARWMDLTDPECHYQRVVSRLSTLSSLLLNCVCAVTAQQLYFLSKTYVWRDVALRYYSESCSLLRHILNHPEPQSDAVTAAILLSSYEVLAEQGEEHQRHFEGAMRLIIARGITARALGLDKANFWHYVRHELVIATLNERPLGLPAAAWNVSYTEHPATTEHDLTQELLWLAGRTIDLSYGQIMAGDRHKLVNDVADWYARMSPQCRGIRYGSEDGGQSTQIHFPVPVTATAMLWYHTLCIMLEIRAPLQSSLPNTAVNDHATEILNIGGSILPNEVRCFAVVPLFFAGKHASGAILKTKAIMLLDTIEKELGWHTQASIRTLQQQLDAQLHR